MPDLTRECKVTNSVKRAPRENTSLFTEGVLLAGATLAGYAVNGCYEWGYLSHFGIPPHLMEITSSTLLASTGLVLAGFAVLLGVLDISAPLLRRKQIRSGSAAIAFLLVAALLCLLNGARTSASLIAAIAGVGIWLEFLHPALRKRSQKRSRGQESQSDASIETSNRGSTSLVERLIGTAPISHTLAIALIMFFCFIAYAAGEGQARGQRYFFIDEDKPTQVVVRVYNSRAVGFVLKKHRIHASFFARAIPSDAVFVQVEGESLGVPTTGLTR